MPLPLLAIGISAGIGALMEAVSEFQQSGDPQALQAAKQARGQAIMDAMAQGMSRMEAEQNVDASVLDAIKRNEREFNMGNVVGGAVVGGALGGLGAAAAGTKWGAQALSKMGMGRGAVGAKYAKPAGPQKPMTIDKALARAEAGPAVTRRTIAPSPEPAPFRAPEEVLTQFGRGKNGPADAARAAEDLLTGRSSPLPPRSSLVGRQSTWNPPLTGEVIPPVRPTGVAPYRGADTGPRTYDAFAMRQPVNPQLEYRGNVIYQGYNPPVQPTPMGWSGAMPPRGEAINPDFMRKTGQWVDEVGDTGQWAMPVDDFALPAGQGGTLLRGPGQFAETGSPEQRAFIRALDQAMLRNRMSRY